MHVLDARPTFIILHLMLNHHEVMSLSASLPSFVFLCLSISVSVALSLSVSLSVYLSFICACFDVVSDYCAYDRKDEVEDREKD